VIHLSTIEFPLDQFVDLLGDRVGCLLILFYVYLIFPTNKRGLIWSPSAQISKKQCAMYKTILRCEKHRIASGVFITY